MPENPDPRAPNPELLDAVPNPLVEICPVGLNKDDVDEPRALKGDCSAPAKEAKLDEANAEAEVAGADSALDV